MERYYVANIGRFITRDTCHEFEDEPRRLNQYAYTNNNSVMFGDSSGHIVLFVVGAVTDGAIAMLFDALGKELTYFINHIILI